jgi:hypothetical protein
MAGYGSDHENPNYVESVASLKRKTKEDIRIDQLIPSHILEDAVNTDGSPDIKTLLEYYYKFMNMEEFIYTSTETYTDLLSASTTHVDGSGDPQAKASFRIPDPNNENNQFFSDSTGASSTLVIDNAGTDVTISMTGTSVPIISNGNELPGSLVNSLTPTGKTFTVDDLPRAYIGKYATLTTVAKHWVGPGPSYVLNAIEEAMNIDENSDTYLNMMQKEIAAAIPRDLTSVEKRSLYKNITEFYKLKGAQDSIEIFFRLLFDENVEVEYPWNETFIPSSGDWDGAQNRYLDHKGWLSDKIKLQDSYYYQKFSYNIKTGKNLADWRYAFDRLIHPAGFIFFGEVLILTELTRLILGDYQKVSATTAGDGLVQDPENPGYQYRYLNVYPRSGRKTLSSMPGLQPGVIGPEDIALLVEAFASTFLPNIIAKVDKSATLSTNFSGGQITSIEIIDGGWGYPSAPVLTITGDNGSSATATCTIDTDTGVVETTTITNAGSGYTTAYTSAAANPDISKIKTINLSNLGNKTYADAPVLAFDVPTSVDSDGVPLNTNITATATIQIAAADDLSDEDNPIYKGEITGYTITEDGFGYIRDPRIRIISPSESEDRGKDVKEIAIIMLNHVANKEVYQTWGDGFKTLSENDYFESKNTYYANKKFRDNYPISFFSENIIGSTYESVINKYNVKTNIAQE